ncbi:hypothetical protein FSP39_001169 [Pinctada imbricata]|uniref:DNA polymerase subunit gamma-1 n=1 Tax=Pinctada imbricata TaxID=66713 RepID=A0AA88YCA2_PINIB|nr:hypothetical protein FSP39_001169 [Pinctada imbricata]
MPKLLGENIDEHFKELAFQQLEGYYELAEELMDCQIPPKPKVWNYAAGWTKYDPVTGEATLVDFPEENAFIFDIEVLVKEGHFPTMATALSATHWYSWCADCLIQDRYRWINHQKLHDLIPLETSKSSIFPPNGEWEKKIIVGHNVGFDRSFIKEQYFIEKTKARFIDTMSLHIATCGLTNMQRVLYQAAKKNSNLKVVREYNEAKRQRNVWASTEWQTQSSLNNLNDVYQLHCGGPKLEKETREIFVEGSMTDVREQFQELTAYCASDVEATLKVFKKLWPEFLLRFPHPVTLAGMFEMSSAYLPINCNWQRYIQQSNAIYEDLQNEQKRALMKLANEACEYLFNEKYKEDLWLWDLDWSVKEFRMKKIRDNGNIVSLVVIQWEYSKSSCDTMGIKILIENSTFPYKQYTETDEEMLKRILDTKQYIFKVKTHKAGYPKWYADLCPKLRAEDWNPGPSLISTLMRVTPKLMRVTYNGYPLHYDEKHAWGYLVPDKVKAAQDREKMMEDDDDEDEKHVLSFPIKALFEFCGDKVDEELLRPMTDEEFENMMNNSSSMVEESMEWEEKQRHLEAAAVQSKARKDQEIRFDVGIPGAWFYKIPHKDGKGSNVGNPLAKDYILLFENGTMKTLSGTNASKVLKLSKTCSYWKMAKDRIQSQMAVELQENELPDLVKRHDDFEEDSFYGAIIPRIVPAGTVTRRAVEKTWLTASNAYADRVGSELKAMIQAPPGCDFVGADVDSQELWIAAIIGDSFARMHGCTPFGWMTLQGKKSEKTDLHSKTAETVGISRDHAKVLNYGRIYGAGQKFAETLLKQFNPNLTPIEANKKARLMYTTTKGKKESETFNRLEEIATREHPKTPVLNCSISKSLQPENVGEEFMTSRINWVVQSSAVDYLHLMLVCMRWLFDEYDINGRFCISIHDEVRYLVTSEDKYRAALALQITNLLTRSLFAYKLGMKNLPQSVAFFSAVDIDKCLRKEVHLDCSTPSNRYGMERGYGLPKGQYGVF